MINIIENDILKIEINSLGAELSSIKNKQDGLEYLWQGDPAVWGRKAPILFPIVGRLKDNECYIDGDQFHLSQHGFARDLDFQVTQIDNNKLVYELMYTEESLKQYPYKFVLTISYELKENNLSISYGVKNLDSDTIYFSIGAHPGFIIPFLQGEEIEDYYLEFELAETVNRYQLTDDNTVSTKGIPFLNNEKTLPLTKDIFNTGAIILLDLASNNLALKSRKNNKQISVKYDGFPYMGIWGMPESTPFVCIEPWYGVADFEDTDKQYKTKRGIQQLAVDKEFTASYSISIN